MKLTLTTIFWTAWKSVLVTFAFVMSIKPVKKVVVKAAMGALLLSGAAAASPLTAAFTTPTLSSSVMVKLRVAPRRMAPVLFASKARKS